MYSSLRCDETGSVMLDIQDFRTIDFHCELRNTHPTSLHIQCIHIYIYIPTCVKLYMEKILCIVHRIHRHVYIYIYI